MKSLKILLITAVLMLLWMGQTMAQTVYLYDVTPDYTIEGLEPVIVETESGSDWTKEDTARQLAYTALAIYDWGQTLYLLQPSSFAGYVPNSSGTKDWVEYHNAYKFHELNPILGPYPTREQINTYFALQIPFNYYVAQAIKNRTWRLTWQIVGLGLETYCVTGNIQLGAQVKF